MFRPFLLFYSWWGGPPLAYCDEFSYFWANDKLNDLGRLVFCPPVGHPVHAVISAQTLAEYANPMIVALRYGNAARSLSSTAPLWLGFLTGYKGQASHTLKSIYTGYSMNWLLSSRRILFEYGEANKNVFAAVEAETILKYLVNQNLAGSTSGRFRSGVNAYPTVSTATGQARGSQLTRRYYLNHLLPAMREVAHAGGVYWHWAFDGEYSTLVFDVDDYQTSVTTDWVRQAGRMIYHEQSVDRVAELRAGVGVTTQREENYSEYYEVSEDEDFYDREDILSIPLTTADTTALTDAAISLRLQRIAFPGIQVDLSPSEIVLPGFDMQLGAVLQNLRHNAAFHLPPQVGESYTFSGWNLLRKDNGVYKFTLDAVSKPAFIGN